MPVPVTNAKVNWENAKIKHIKDKIFKVRLAYFFSSYKMLVLPDSITDAIILKKLYWNKGNLNIFHSLYSELKYITSYRVMINALCPNPTKVISLETS